VQMIVEPKDIQAVRPPTWMTRAQRNAYFGILRAKDNQKNSISARDIALAETLVCAEWRLRELRRMLTQELRERRAGSQLESVKRNIISLSKAIDGTAERALRLRRGLGLLGEPNDRRPD
jgi:hypothetical protein